jgi:type II secretory pathway component PulJ
MRKGYLLAEMIVILSIMMLVLLITGRFFRTFAYELPRDFRLVQENCVLNNAVSHIRTDVASAKVLSESLGDSAESALLVMKLPDGDTVSYKFDDGRILRRGAGAKDTTSGDTIWSVPHGRIEWRVWRRDQTGYAVELRTCIEYKDLGHMQRKMANNYLFFADTVWEAAK